ncbi:MAG: YggT family protein [Desulfobacterales bacterium]|jgi:YggT family protein|nr:YggT family protein [Desulfobacteraceae bacterium]MBT7085304.1 YggT family protein [Desulfobacterales bacterium]MBT7696423.1 YggT family protein [Desulfobacterales bacterium]
MFVISHFITAVAVLLNYVLEFYFWIIIARAILSWVSPDPYNPIVRFIHDATEPVLYQIRSKLPVTLSGIDFAPIIVVLGIKFLQIFIVGSLSTLAQRLV